MMRFLMLCRGVGGPSNRRASKLQFSFLTNVLDFFQDPTPFAAFEFIALHVGEYDIIFIHDMNMNIVFLHV